MNSRTCNVQDCGRPHMARGLCQVHYMKWYQRNRNLARKQPNVGLQCSVEGCERPAKIEGLCVLHDGRKRRNGDPLVIRIAAKGEGHTGRDGYRYVRRNRRSVREHRAVMEDLLHRPLRADESVHHKNGNRADNRPENLELRVRFHGLGQSVDEALRWAHELIARYEPRR